MPELPEVETVRRGLSPGVVGHRIVHVDVREPRLRWPVAEDLGQVLGGRRIRSLQRRSKYLLFELERGWLISHLGMSGTWRLVAASAAWLPHDHVVIGLEGSADRAALVYNDPRRFGSLHYHDGAPAGHWLIAGIGPEPLDAGFDGAYLHAAARGVRRPVKHFLMDAGIVAGVGNIYACESLHHSGIHPHRHAGRVSRRRYDALASAVRRVLTAAIAQGGTTLRDFAGADGTPGYFQIDLDVYGRGGQPCRRCGRTLLDSRLGGRTTVYCGHCQR